MAELPNITAHHTKLYGYDRVELLTDDAAGWLQADINHQTKEFEILMVMASTPRIGLGKALLRRAAEEAQLMGAQTISACIVSAECLASMTDVFGRAAIHVDERGDFDQVYDAVTRAQLNYVVPPLVGVVELH